ncbi:MAG TPA: cobalamin-binding protein [Burkholderiales bacterium]|nr:cobalamin-binding protein [Burkholderiales bacterium]
MIRVAVFAFAVSFAAGVQALQLRDDRGVTVALGGPAERIVALAPHLAEAAFAAGAGARVVGVSTFTRYPPEARGLPVVASFGRVDLERLIALRPQLVLAWQTGNSPLQIARLERLGFPVFVTETRSLADIPRLVRLVGELAGSVAVAETEAHDLENEIARLRKRYAGERSIAVFLEIWHAPMLTVNGEHLASDALRLCGGRNVFAAAKTLTPLVSREQLLAVRPEAIITAGAGAPQAWRGLDAVPAVRRHRVFAIDPDLMYGQGPRFLEGARTLCDRLERARN